MFPLKNRDFLSGREIKKVSLSIAIGFILAIICSFIFGRERSEIGLLACFIGVGITYFLIGNLVFKK
ncbi:MAG: hypothetical protein ACQ9MH_17530 [Nitrospinales bacterium]|jgi:uncharacterized membrane protein